MSPRSDIPNAFPPPPRGISTNPQAIIKVFSNLWLHTGHLGQVDTEGNGPFVGRVKNVIWRRGEDVTVSEIEEEFPHHPEVAIAAAFAISSELGLRAEDDVKVSVKLREESSTMKLTLFDWAMRNVARFQVLVLLISSQRSRKQRQGNWRKMAQWV
ncbi:uncharacterized protein Z518_10445 [Rhinocladiella mackenziei CBS 650.93]|uniref:Rhinocladiella mackenziei CBS 650.93 unplaced genomic scaffold supercont1.9, whole genome shotgun sequence n=1 Tax=Rhinocladiella mackenziei CBS 650.93 TaxID=1442369 RepID=A0A0D2IAM5_9EURO|nr:uncharacterized protein Z518_10445 [Rhinocladiella mackenziei CBS 650.93]KIX00306.1 hypothetical protein Z518_10445 [Rhinocladiella mackenziei CBS 650.93]